MSGLKRLVEVDLCGLDPLDRSECHTHSTGET
jgi:hypothetical protein